MEGIQEDTRPGCKSSFSGARRKYLICSTRYHLPIQRENELLNKCGIAGRLCAQVHVLQNKKPSAGLKALLFYREDRI